MWLLLLASLTAARAVTPDEVEARMGEVSELRAMRKASKPPAIPVAESRRAAEGAIVTGMEKITGTPWGNAYGVAVLNVPIATLWSAINDESRHPGYTATTYAEVIKGRPCGAGRRILQVVSAPVVGDKWSIGVPSPNTEILRYSGGSVRELTFKSSVDATEVTSASGLKILGTATPIASSQGSWFLVAMDSRNTYVEYYVRSDPGVSVPGFMVSSIAAKGVRSTLEAIQKFALEGRPSCPIE